MEDKRKEIKHAQNLVTEDNLTSQLRSFVFISQPMPFSYQFL